MRKIILSLTAIFILHGNALAQEWLEKKGDHFIVYYVKNEAQAKDIVYRAEIYYNRIADDLGYQRYSNFWQWDNRCKIYVHPDKAAFQKVTGQPRWSHGMASYFDKTIHTIDKSAYAQTETPPDFLNAVLPHEITHLIFRDFVGFNSYIPLWIDEGVAQWEEENKREEAKKVIRVLLGRAEVFSLHKLTTMDIRQSTDAQQVAVFYAQAISVVDFMIKKYGSARFTDFCRQLRDGKDLLAAAKSAFSSSIQSLDDLESAWSDFVMQTYPNLPEVSQ